MIRSRGFTVFITDMVTICIAVSISAVEETVVTSESSY